MRLARAAAVAVKTVAVGVAVAGGVLLRRRGDPPSLHPVFRGGPLLIAHRGGAGLAPENTLPAFLQAVERWNADMIELDVHATRDGRVVAIHDPTVDRTTDGTGAVASMTLEELRRLDAGYRFTPDGGATYPFRGQGVRVPTIDEVLETLPGTRLTIELKAPAAQRPLLDAIARHGAADRVVLAAEKDEARTLFREYPGPTSASARQLRLAYLLDRGRLALLWHPPVQAAQLPETWEGRRILSPRLVRSLHAHGMAVHVWTVNDPADMERLLDWGVDGLVTDRPDLLAEVLVRRGVREAPAHAPPAAGPGPEPAPA